MPVELTREERRQLKKFFDQNSHKVKRIVATLSVIINTDRTLSWGDTLFVLARAPLAYLFTDSETHQAVQAARPVQNAVVTIAEKQLTPLYATIDESLQDKANQLIMDMIRNQAGNKDLTEKYVVNLCLQKAFELFDEAKSKLINNQYRPRKLSDVKKTYRDETTKESLIDRLIHGEPISAKFLFHYAINQITQGNTKLEQKRLLYFIQKHLPAFEKQIKVMGSVSIFAKILNKTSSVIYGSMAGCATPYVQQITGCGPYLTGPITDPVVCGVLTCCVSFGLKYNSDHDLYFVNLTDPMFKQKNDYNRSINAAALDQNVRLSLSGVVISSDVTSKCQISNLPVPASGTSCLFVEAQDLSYTSGKAVAKKGPTPTQAPTDEVPPVSSILKTTDIQDQIRRSSIKIAFETALNGLLEQAKTVFEDADLRPFKEMRYDIKKLEGDIFELKPNSRNQNHPIRVICYQCNGVNWPLAIDHFHDGAKQNHKNIAQYQQLGDALKQQGYFAEALEKAQKEATVAKVK